jgi:predicted dehydrogenase
VGAKFGRSLYPPQPPANAHALLFREFFAALAQGRPAPVTGDDGRAAVELCSAIYQAALTGAAVDLPLDAASMVYSGVRKDVYSASAAG